MVPMPQPTAIPNRLGDLMQDKGVRLAVLAALCDVDQSTVYRWREGTAAMADQHKVTLARFFEVTVEDLMRWPDDVAQPPCAA